MKNIVLVTSLVIAAALTSTLVFAQHQADTAKGNVFYTKRGVLSGNNIEVIFFNHGEFGYWPDQPSFDWPFGSGHSYCSGSAFIVQSKATDRYGNIIHPLETSFRVSMRRDTVTGLPAGWEPLYGYANPSQPSPAISSSPETWPAHWPNTPPDWDGQWNGYFGRGVRPGLTETYFVMDDDPDRQYLNRFHPDSTDTTRGGLGVEVAVRSLQWNAANAIDLLFIQFEIVNEGTTQYDSAYVALYVDPSIGGVDDSYDDIAGVIPSSNLFFVRDSDGVGQPGNWSPVGVAGLVLLATPDNQGMTSATVFPVHYYELRDDEQNWLLLRSRTFSLDSLYDANLAAFISSGPFTLNPDDNKRFVCAYVFADDTLQLFQRVDFARRFYASGFSDTLLTGIHVTNPIPTRFSLNQNYPNPFNPTTTISFHLSERVHVRLKVFDLLGREVRSLVDRNEGPGVHEVSLSAVDLPTGVYFYRLEAGSFVQTKKLVILR